jgi:hypothetical protein
MTPFYFHLFIYFHLFVICLMPPQVAQITTPSIAKMTVNDGLERRQKTVAS